MSNEAFSNVQIASGSLASTLTGDSHGVAQFSTGSVQAVWTGTPTGDFTIEVSNDAPNTTPSNWTELPDSTQAAGGAAGSHVWYLDHIGYTHIRLVYTSTSGTGSVTARFTGK